MRTTGWDVTAALEASPERVAIRPVAELADALDALHEDRSYWGILLTPASARLARETGAVWSELLRANPILQARVFDDRTDLQWRDQRGVVLRVLESNHAVDGGETAVGGEGWYRRERRARLWGKALDGEATWYEERIPAPHAYEGVDPGHRFVFLRYVEYVAEGGIRHVRYVDVEGSGAEDGEDA